MNFKVLVTPDEGYWAGGRFVFSIAIPAAYPHEAPKVHCDTRVRFPSTNRSRQLAAVGRWRVPRRGAEDGRAAQVYHPNLDLEGNVCLNILREEWKPILSVSAVVYGLQFLFLEPNADDPLNKAAAEVMMQNPTQFKRNVYSSMRGGYVDGVRFG